MTGQAEVERRRRRLRATFTLIDGQGVAPEITAHYARYLCILVSGFAEQSVKDLVAEYARRRASPQLYRYVQAQLRPLRNIDVEKLKQLLQSLEPGWWDELSEDYAEELDALGSVTATRNNIAHGGDSGITILTIRQYFYDLDRLMRKLTELLDPDPNS